MITKPSLFIFTLFSLFGLSCESEQAEDQNNQKPQTEQLKKTVDPKYLAAYQNQAKLSQNTNPLLSLYQQNNDQEASVTAPMPNKWIQLIKALNQSLAKVKVKTWKYEQTTHANPKEQSFELRLSLEIEDLSNRVESVVLQQLKSIVPQVPSHWPKAAIEADGKSLVIKVSKLQSQEQGKQKHLLELSWIKDQVSADRNINCRQIQGLPPQQGIPEWMVKALNNSGDKKLLQASYEQKGKQGQWDFLIQYRNGGVRDEWADFWVQAMSKQKGNRIEQQDFYQSWRLEDQSTLAWWQESSAPEMGCIFESALMAVRYRLP